MYVAWSQQQIFNNISLHFHSDFALLQKTIIQPNEKVLYACNRSISTINGFTDPIVKRMWFGYYVITQFRRLSVIFGGWEIFGSGENKQGIFYPQQTLGNKIFGGEKDRRYWWYPPYFEIIDAYERHFSESRVKEIMDFSRNDYLVTPKNKLPINLVEFKVKTSDVSFRNYFTYQADDGQKVYDLLQYSWQNNGSIEM